MTPEGTRPEGRDLPARPESGTGAPGSRIPTRPGVNLAARA